MDKWIRLKHRLIGLKSAMEDCQIKYKTTRLGLSVIDSVQDMMRDLEEEEEAEHRIGGLKLEHYD